MVNRVTTLPPSEFTLKTKTPIPLQLRGKVYVFMVRFKGHTLNLPLLKLDELNVAVLSALYNAERASWLLMVNGNGANVIDAAYSLKRINGVKSVKVFELTPLNLVKYASYLEDYSLNLSLSTRRMFIDVLNELKVKWGSGGEVLAYYLGYEYGVLSFSRFQQLCGRLNLKLERRELYDLMVRMLCIRSGDVNLVEFSETETKAVLRIRNLSECSKFKGRLNKENSQFYRGAISGLSSKAFGLDMMAKEVKCVAKGDDCCEFEVLKHTICIRNTG